MILSILASALFAGFVAILVTSAIEHFGGRLGGVLATLPTTIVPATWGIFQSGHSEAFIDAMFTVPAGMFVNALFLWIWGVVPDLLHKKSEKAQLIVTTILAMLLWLIAGCCLLFGIQALKTLHPWAILLFGTLSLFTLVAFGLFSTQKPQESPKGKNRTPPLGMLARGVMAAGAIGATTFIAKLGFGIASGLASIFPALFLTSMIMLWLQQGRSVTQGAIGSMMLGSSSVAGYGVLAGLLYIIGVKNIYIILPLTWVLSVSFFSVPARFWVERQYGKFQKNCSQEKPCSISGA